MSDTQRSRGQEYHLLLDEYCDDPVGHLAEHCSLSKQQVKQAMQKGAAWVGAGKKVKHLRRNRGINAGNTLHFYYNPKILSEQPPTPTLISDQQQYSIWFKPYGMYAQGSKWGDHCTIARWAERQLDRPSFIVHRLDRATSGLIIVAHSKTTAAKLAKLFEQHSIRKRYLAICRGILHEPTTVTLAIDDKPACSHLQPLHSDADQTLVCVDIDTGRKHQIRKHLAAIGHPIIGDRLHGDAKQGDIDLQLCAFHLDFMCPNSGDNIDITVKLEQLPDSYQCYTQSIAAIGGETNKPALGRRTDGLINSGD